MTEDLPLPLTAPDCDLRDFRFMPIEVERLRRSRAWLICKRSPELGFFMLNLWASSWHEVPAASLEDDDDVLADAAMCEPKKWKKIRDLVLRGWVKCQDGRLYHPIVAEKANEAWESKTKQRSRTKAATEARRKRDDDRDGQHTINRDDSRNEDRNDHRNGQRDDTVTSTKGRDREETGKGEQEKRRKKEAAGAAFSLPDWIPKQPWQAFLEMRQKKRAVPTANAIELLIAKLSKIRASGHDIAEVLNASVMNNWTDLYEPKAKQNGNGAHAEIEHTDAHGWFKRLEFYMTDRPDAPKEKRWLAKWGPKPEDPKTLVPKDVIKNYPRPPASQAQPSMENF